MINILYVCIKLILSLYYNNEINNCIRCCKFLNKEYYMFIPKQIFFWKYFAINFIAVIVGKNIPEELKEYSNNIILWNRNLNLNTAFVAQNLRMYYTALINKYTR